VENPASAAKDITGYLDRLFNHLRPRAIFAFSILGQVHTLPPLHRCLLPEIAGHHDNTLFIEFNMANQHQSLTAEEVFSSNGHQRQDIIAGKLSWLIRDEYLEDIIQHREYMEACPSIKRISIMTFTDQY
jgi:hypothetical protein